MSGTVSARFRRRTNVRQRHALERKYERRSPRFGGRRSLLLLRWTRLWPRGRIASEPRAVMRGRPRDPLAVRSDMADTLSLTWRWIRRAGRRLRETRWWGLLLRACGRGGRQWLSFRGVRGWSDRLRNCFRGPFGWGGVWRWPRIAVPHKRCPGHYHQDTGGHRRVAWPV
jgi:hypothetical protein